MDESKYRPGVCNIGPEEIKARRKGGITLLIASIILFVFLLIIGVNPIWRLLIFFPVTLSATGFLQAYFHFCVGFGMKGVYNVAKSVGNTDTVTQAEFRKKDKQKALQIFGMSALIGSIISSLGYSI